MTSPAELAEVRSRLTGALKPDKETDMRICCAAIGGTFFRLSADGDAFLYTLGGEGPIHRGERLPVTSSIDHATRLVDRAFPGIWWFLARGRVQLDEPLYGAQLMFGQEVLGKGEHHINQAMALCIALISTLEMRLAPADQVPS